jgi:hypothetical protein
MNISERVSISSKLKESKNSAGSISTNGYESSANNSKGFKMFNTQPEELHEDNISEEFR